jgi:hypothetical protein
MPNLHPSNVDISSSQWPQSFYIRIYIRRTVRVSVVDLDPVGSGFGIIVLVPDPDQDLTLSFRTTFTRKSL